MATQIVINDPVSQRHIPAPAIAVVSSDANNALRTGSDGNLFVQGSGGGSSQGLVSSDPGNYARYGNDLGVFVGGQEILSNGRTNLLHISDRDGRVELTVDDLEAEGFVKGGGGGELKPDVDQLKSDMTVVKSDLNTAKSDITGLRRDVDKNTADITQLKRDIQDIEDITIVSTDRNNVLIEGRDGGAYLDKRDIIEVVEDAGITKIDVRDLINTGDPLLTVRNDKLVSGLTMQYNAASGRVDILGVHGNSIASAIIPTAVTMLQHVELVDNPIGQPAGTYIHFTFRLQDGSTTDMYLNVSRLAQFYTAGDGIHITTDGVVSVDHDRIEEIVSDAIEDGDIHLVSTDRGNLLTTGNDGRPFLDPDDLPSGVSSDAGNALRLGSDDKPYLPLDYGTL